MHQQARPARSRLAASYDEADLEEAIEERQLILHYQPKVLLRSRTLVGFEALVRWKHPDRGMMSPVDFVPAADRTRLAVPLGRWVLTQACRQMATWNRARPDEAPLTISVNTSWRYLAAPCLIPDVERIVSETGLNAASLNLDMHERSMGLGCPAAISILRALHAMKIGLAIDDFGTGTGSVRYIRELPIDTITIHRSFVKKLGMPNDSSKVVTSIVKVVKSLGMTATAQGVETDAQLEILMDLGCSDGQGYYFSRPVEAARATALIAKMKLNQQMPSGRSVHHRLFAC
jgi:EAL domain-containing protein (putative c-di-GMP-specific phosphodiesterase class I)